MVIHGSRYRIRSCATGVVVIAALTVVGFAAPAAAQAQRPAGAAICVRAGRQFDRLVAANQAARRRSRERRRCTIG